MIETMLDSERLGASAEIIGSAEELEVIGLPGIMLPIAGLLGDNLLRRSGDKQYVFTSDVEVVTDASRRIKFAAGDVVKATERYVGQTDILVVFDYRAMRARRERGQQ